MHAGFCLQARAVGRLWPRSASSNKTSLHYAHFVLCGILLGSSLPQALLTWKNANVSNQYIGFFIFKFFSRQLLFLHFMCYWNENSVQKLHNKVVINPLWFVTNREILSFRQTFLESALIFAKKMYVVKWKGGFICQRNTTHPNATLPSRPAWPMTSTPTSPSA